MFTTRPEIAGTFGVVASTHWIASQVGMAVLEIDPAFDLAGLKPHLKPRLPHYAWPVFLRLVSSLALTETFKQKKSGLAAEGFNPAHVEDPLYADLGAGYEPLDAVLYERVNSGLTRL